MKCKIFIPVWLLIKLLFVFLCSKVFKSTPMENIYSLKYSKISQIIGEGLKRERLAQNITQQDMSDQINVSVSSIKKIEKGEICSFDSLLRVLKRLGKLEVLEPLLTTDDAPTLEELKDMVQEAKAGQRVRASGKHLRS